MNIREDSLTAEAMSVVKESLPSSMLVRTILSRPGSKKRNLSAPKAFDLVFVYVNAENAVSASGKTRSGDKPHVTRSYNGYFHLLNLPGKTCEERSRRNFSATKRQHRVQQILKK